MPKSIGAAFQGTPTDGAAVTAGFDAELLFVARRMGARSVEVPVTWQYVGTHRVHPLRESWRGLKGLLLIRAAAARGEYDRAAPASIVTDVPPQTETLATSEPPRAAGPQS